MAAGGATLAVTTTDTSGEARNTFVVGETFNLKIVGDAQGERDSYVIGYLGYDGDITDTISAVQDTQMYAHADSLYISEGGPVYPTTITEVFGSSNDSTSPEDPLTQIQLSTVTLIATAVGSSLVNWNGEELHFFNQTTYIPSESHLNPAHSFTIVPEPATAGLIALGMLGLVLGPGRGRAR
jgi:hypothetical protein